MTNADLGFWKNKTIEELAIEQGIRIQDVDAMLGQGANLWESDDEFEDFLRV